MTPSAAGFTPFTAKRGKPMAPWPQPLVVEHWGDTPLFAGPAWRLSWTLDKQQRAWLQQAMAEATFWGFIQACAPTLAKRDCPWSPPAACLDEPALEMKILLAIATLARLLVGQATLEPCASKVRAQVRPTALVLRCDQHELAGAALQLAAGLLHTACLQRQGRCTPAKQRDWRQPVGRHLTYVGVCCDHPLTTAMLAEAARRGIPVFLLDATQRLYQFGTGEHGRLVSSSSNDADSSMGVALARDKSRCRSFLKQLGLPVPNELRLHREISEQQLLQVVSSIGYPCVLKPQNAEQGLGATADIQDQAELLLGLQQAKKYSSSSLLLQNHVSGADHRLNMVHGKLDSVVKRSAPEISGTGHDSIRELISELNHNRRQRRRVDGVSTEINSDDPELIARIRKAGYTMDSLLEQGLSLQLRGNANLSSGGLREEISPNCVHSRIRQQCEAIAKSLRLDVCGIDYLTPDISADPESCRGAYIEVNSMPQNASKRAGLLLDNLFRDRTPIAIPVCVVLSDWKQEDDASHKDNLLQILADRPGARLAYPADIKSRLIATLGQGLLQQGQSFQHPRELMIDKSIQSVVYLMTHDQVLSRGLPVPARQGLRVVSLGTRPEPEEAWAAFLGEYAGAG
jgi:D-alanine-D-alanine ligase-like ATP-grasp enzyme